MARWKLRAESTDARHLFDGMAHRGERRDLIGALPDAVIQHVLGFLPAREAVRTCVLARRWRHLWRPIPRLRIADVEAFGSVEELNEFVDRLLLLRDRGSALVEFEFDLRGFLQLDDARIDLWIRHALMCHVRVLQVHLYTDRRVELADQPLVSRHLTRLELDGVLLEESFLEFSSCPVLEDLKVTNCVISADKILSQSLKHLSIMGCELCWRLLPTHVSAPSLVSLQLDDYVGVTPILESMLLLQTASVKLGHNNEDYCDFCDKGSSGDCTCSMCLIYWDNDCRNDVSVLLGGLSSATYLELIASSGMVTLKRDLRYCPTFSKLKSLLLNDWCLVADLSALLCFLQHTLILEKLTLQLSKRLKPAMEMEGSNLMEQSLTLKRLKIVEVKCQMIDERVQNFLNLLSSCSICLEQINVQKI